MKGNLDVVRFLAKNALAASKKRRQMNAFFKKQGFVSLGKGAWLGFRNRDLVSGCLIDGSPLDTYIETFILPAFDRRDFITWGLGDRVVHCSPDTDTEEECMQAVNVYRTEMSKVRSPTDLITYIDTHQITGHYPIWVKYICYLRLLRLDTAIQYLTDSRRDALHRVQIEQFEEVNGFVAMGDADGVLRVLEKWSAISEKILGPFDQPVDIYR